MEIYDELVNENSDYLKDWFVNEHIWKMWLDTDGGRYIFQPSHGEGETE